MALVKPPRVQYRYEVQADVTGRPTPGHYADGTQYFNVLAFRDDGSARNPVRVIARTATVEEAWEIVNCLTRCTASLHGHSED